MLTIPANGGKPARQVHYRRCGSGPMLLMVHQSPRSSAEYEALMQRWSTHFTCVAPDTPGFGQSDPLGGHPEIDDFADALAEFLAVLGAPKCAAYGFHSGGVILIAALKRNTDLFSCLAIGGYAIWTQSELELFSDYYLPEWHPTEYGEHLTWLWNRMLEQSWFFPWFDTRDEARLMSANADVARVTQAVDEMLDSGNHYQAGYGAVLRAPRDIPMNREDVPPCLITAADSDPLQSHIDRLGDIPANWEARKVATPQDHQDASFAFLEAHAGHAPCPALAEDSNEGWLELADGLIHWCGERGSDTLILHEPAQELAEPQAGTIAIDVPGHGHSSDFDDIEGAIEAAAHALGAARVLWPDAPRGDPDLLYPDLTPDRFGSYLLRAWSAARAEAFFRPWYDASSDTALPVDQMAIKPASIAKRARARLRAGNAANRFHHILPPAKGHSS